MTHNHEAENAATIIDRINREAAEWRDRAEKAERQRAEADAAQKISHDLAMDNGAEADRYRTLIARGVEVWRTFNWYQPDFFASKEERDAKLAELHRLGDVRCVYVNEGDWIMLQIALHALAADLRKAGEGV